MKATSCDDKRKEQVSQIQKKRLQGQKTKIKFRENDQFFLPSTDGFSSSIISTTPILLFSQ